MSPISVESLRQWVADRYELLEPIRVHLIRSYTNHVFAVHTPGARFVLKAYGAGWRTRAEISYEIDLLDHLAAHDVPVARAIQALDGQSLHSLDERGIRYHAVLFEFAAGKKPAPPFAPELYYHEGRAVAAMHAAADEFRTPHRRRDLDLDYLLNEPVETMRQFLSSDDDAQALNHMVGQIRRTIESLAADGLDWGPIHGDVSFDNLHIVRDHRFVWYDFDSGGPGWRAVDLQGWASFDPSDANRWQSFLRGYRAVRPIGQNDIEAAPWLTAAMDVWGVTVDLENRIILTGETASRAYVRDAIARLRLRVAALPADE